MMKFLPVLRSTVIALVLYALLMSSGVALAGDAPEAQGPYKAEWGSLTAVEVPEWLLDAKFGIYAHWGLYSVPAYASAWYASKMYDPRQQTFVHHTRTYGDPSEFGYKDFAELFKAEHFDPEAWADLIALSGAKYAGIAVVHHDGFGLWDSGIGEFNAGKMGPKRDLYGELTQALRKKEGMRVIATFHHMRTFDWFLPESERSIERGRKAGFDLYDPQYASIYWNRYTGNFQDFIACWQDKVREVIDKYRPDLLWFDGGQFQEENSGQRVLDILSYYHNRAHEWGKEVQVLNKLPTTKEFNFPENYGMLTFEEGRDRPARVDRPWVDDQKIGVRNWSYIEGQTYKPANEIIDGLVDRVSRGGGLLLSLSPKADGTIGAEQVEVLSAMGAWFKINGDAIYGTRTWKIQAEGALDHILIEDEDRMKWVFDRCTAKDIRFTQKNNTLYAIVLDWPEGGILTIRSLGTMTKVATEGIRSVSLLGSNEHLAWERDVLGIHIRLPKEAAGEHAYAFRIEGKGNLTTQ